MTDRDLDRLFARYRRSGDVSALGLVFDETAPELVRIAAAWTRDADEVEDLVQETFLTAIERAERYDTKRRLLPWLAGILVMHAQSKRRERGRRPDPDRLEQRDVATPEAGASTTELAREVASALAQVNERERGVLESFLKEGKSPSAIAAELGERAGTVRMRIHRGLERLRAALPAGAALSGAMLVSGRRGWAAVRGDVLARARTLADERSVVAMTSTGMLGGLLVNKLTLSLVALAVLLGLAWTVSTGDIAPVEAVSAMELELPARAPLARLDEVPAPRPQEPIERPHAESETARSEASTTQGHVLASFESGLRGRILLAPGIPAVDVGVALIQIDPGSMIRVLGSAASGAEHDPELIGAATTTDENGEFELGGAWPTRFHMLGLDLGGPRGDLRTLPVSFVPGEVVDLGDLVLDSSGSLHGTVLDERGVPVPGARVRLGPALDELAMFGFGDLRPESRVLVKGEQFDDAFAVLPVPAWAAALEDLIPLPTATTDDEGRFHLPHVPALDRLALVVDHPGYPAVAAEPPTVAVDDVVMHPIRLSAGRSVEGVIVDAEGEPVPELEVLVGTRVIENFCVLHPAGKTDAQGRFRRDGLPPMGTPIAVARRTVGDAWSRAVAEAGSIRLVLGAGAEVTVHLVDGDGAPVTGAVLAMDPRSTIAANPLAAFVAEPLRTRDWREPDAGHYVLANSTPGVYSLVIQARGFTTHEEFVEHSSDGSELRFELSPSRSAQVLVVDEIGDPVSAASVTAFGPRETSAQVVATDADGSATLGGLSTTTPSQLRVEHPGFAVGYTELAIDDESLTVVLNDGGSVRAHLFAGGAIPGGPWSLQLLPLQAGSPDGELPRLGASGRDGTVHVERLQPGTYEYSVLTMPAWGASFWDRAASQGALATGQVVVEDGKTAELAIEIDHLPDAEAVTGMVHGRVTVDGEPAKGVVVLTYSFSDPRIEMPSGRTDGAGQFAIHDLLAGEVFVTAHHRLETDEGEVNIQLGGERVELLPGEERELSLDYTIHTLEVRILADGAPVEGVEVSLIGRGETSITSFESHTTNEAGRVGLTTAGYGLYHVRAVHDELGLANAEVDVPEDGPWEPVTLELERGVPCAGRITLSGDDYTGSLGLHVREEESDDLIAVTLEFEEGASDFDLVGLQPGEYSALLTQDGMIVSVAELRLPASGHVGIELEMEVPDLVDEIALGYTD